MHCELMINNDCGGFADLAGLRVFMHMDTHLFHIFQLRFIKNHNPNYLRITL